MPWLPSGTRHDWLEWVGPPDRPTEPPPAGYDAVGALAIPNLRPRQAPNRTETLREVPFREVVFRLHFATCRVPEHEATHLTLPKNRKQCMTCGAVWGVPTAKKTMRARPTPAMPPTTGAAGTDNFGLVEW